MATTEKDIGGAAGGRVHIKPFDWVKGSLRQSEAL